MPQKLDPFVNLVDEEKLRTHFSRLHTAIAHTVAGMPDHTQYIDRHCRAEPLATPRRAVSAEGVAA